MEDIQRCKQCAISINYPGVTLNQDGICNFCEAYNSSDKDQKIIASNHENIQRVVEERRGKAVYDVLVAYSGGKDSSFTLHYFRNILKVKVLALLIDNDFISDQAMINARNVTSALKIDLLIFKPEADFMHNLYNKSLAGNFYNMNQLARANAACLSCINLINNVALNEAIIRQIPIIAGGYIGGQIPSESGVVKLDRSLFKQFRKNNTKMLAEEIDERITNYLDVSEPIDEDQLYPVLLNPLLGMEYSEEEIIEKIKDFGWVKPKDTGQSSSNCLMNDYAIAMHYKKHKFHSYEAEICLQVRRGTMTREIAMEKLMDIRPMNSFKSIQKRLNTFNS